ncbi:MAG: hypothetical protein EHM35_16540 [Planctomycetaceae bacterium]|nr:MAG: hypothetical protein EHM35_16540 [Planctomycetaceae bacterium]
MLTIKPSWNPLIQRLQTEAVKNGSCAVVSISFVVDQNGEVVFYSEPATVRIEPASRKDTVVAWFGGCGVSAPGMVK